MFKYLFILFLLVPLLEIYLLIQVGGVIGALSTVLLVVLTAVVGAYLLRQQGFATLQRARESLERGEVPAGGLLEGAILLVSGALLLTPGFFTDAIGFICLVPNARQAIAAWLLKRATVVTAAGFQQETYESRQGETRHTSERIFEGEFQKDEEKLSRKK